MLFSMAWSIGRDMSVMPAGRAWVFAMTSCRLSWAVTSKCFMRVEKAAIKGFGSLRAMAMVTAAAAKRAVRPLIFPRTF